MFTYTEEKKFTKEQVQQLFLSVHWTSGNYPKRLYKALMNSSTVLTVWDDEKLVGLTRVLDDTEMLAQIHYVLVHPDYQGKGIAGKMIEYINTLEEQVSELDRLILKSLDPNLTKEERIEIERRRAELSKERDEKANWFDDFLNSNGCYSSTQVAKLFKLSSAQKLNKILNENKIIYKKGTNWLPYSDVDKSWYKLIVGSNNEHNYSQLKFSPKGVYEISKLLEIEFEEEDLKKLA